MRYVLCLSLIWWILLTPHFHRTPTGRWVIHDVWTCTPFTNKVPATSICSSSPWPPLKGEYRGLSHCTFQSSNPNTYQVEVGRALQLSTSVQPDGIPRSMAAELCSFTPEITYGKCVHDQADGKRTRSFSIRSFQANEPALIQRSIHYRRTPFIDGDGNWK